MDRTLIEVIYHQELSLLHDEDLVRLLYAQFTSEIDHLKNIPRAVEKCDQVTPGNLTENALSPSRILFNEDFDEVNRTITNVRAAKWLLANDYEAFTAYQPAAVKLSQKTFQTFRDKVLPLFIDPDHLVALIVALVVGDMGKNPHLVNEIAALGGAKDIVNHDQCLSQAVECGILDNPLSQLSDTRREDVILGINIGATLNIPQLAQGENVPGSLKPILQFRDHLSAFHLKYHEIMFDVAGAGGHLDSRGANRMIEPVCQSFLQAWPILEDTITKQTSLREAYDHVLQNRGQLVAEQGFPLLSPNNPSERALLRLFAMGRVADRSTAEQFQNAFMGLSEIKRDALIEGLNVDGIDDGEAVVPYYMPALFAETLRVLRDASAEERLVALKSLMAFMVRIFDGSRPQPGRVGSIKECDVSPAVEIVHSPAFRNDLCLLDEYTLP